MRIAATIPIALSSVYLPVYCGRVSLTLFALALALVGQVMTNDPANQEASHTCGSDTGARHRKHTAIIATTMAASHNGTEVKLGEQSTDS